MRYSTTAVFLAAMYIGASVAKPTHVHQHRHEKKSDAVVDWDKLDWLKMGVNWKEAYEAGEASTTSTTSKTSADDVAVQLNADKPAPTNSASSAGQVDKADASSPDPTNTPKATSKDTSAGSSVNSLLGDLIGIANHLKEFGGRSVSTGSVIEATGNIGKPQGSNMIMVSSASGYDFTANFINTSKKSMTIVVWNKAFYNNATHKIEANLGACVAPKTPILSFTLAAGDNQIVAFDQGSLVGWAEVCPEITPAGAYATTWGEAKFNPNDSGYDMSAIQNIHGNKYNMAISSVEAPNCTSDPTQNYWLTDTKPMGNSDGSCYVPQKTATLTVKMGGAM
ncbi:hypothetical protein DSL72_008599 [Monilinia vaccinii-corymbosi]|uniref:Allergen Asp f 4 n=1 Tax=Monilinia vaccinii-corymbosi TaxID=61207 RepID=A0A8A3PRN3_9HELO|nr:hypothetical protein DSL72_008599 [Monilinia vaccinii-corymbosi]